MLLFGLAGFVVFFLVVLVFCVVVYDVHGITESGGVFGAFVGGVGFEFSAIRGTVLLDFLRFLFGEFALGGRLIFGGVEVSFFLALFFFSFLVLGQFGFASGVNFLGFVFVEVCATDESIGFGVIGGFLVLRLGEFEGQGSGLLIV
jgi:hypothetical protein